MKNVIDTLKDLIIKETEANKGRQLLTANDRYNKLLERGWVKKRGYTLRGIEDIHLLNNKYNVKL